MSKAVLVMDMPESCSKCKFMYEFQGIKKCQLMNCLNNGASKISQHNFIRQRHDKCPLRELPEKKDFNTAMKESIEQDCFDVDNSEDYAYLSGSVRGWNRCIDEVMGERSNK